MAKRIQAPVDGAEERLDWLEKRVAELEGDQKRVAAAFKAQFGEGPFSSALDEIARKIQG